MSSLNLNSLGVKKLNLRKLEVEYVEILSLVPNQYNPNTHQVDSFNLLLKSLCMFGFTQPIVVRKGTNEIIDGEHRWRAAGVIGLELVPVTFIDLTDEERRLATIIHNSARGTHDLNLMKDIDTYLKKKNVDLNKELLKEL